MAYPTEFSGQVSGRRLLVVIASQLLALAMLLAGPALAGAVNSPVAPTDPSMLHVKLLDYATDTVLAGQRIDAYQQRTDGRLKWRARGTTNDEGLVSFDLSNRRLEPGLPLILRARPFGSNAYSEPVKNQPGEFVFKVGQLTVKLVSGASGEAMRGEQVVLKRIDANGRHWWVSRNTTDDDGVAHFDIDNLGEPDGPVVSLRAKVFGGSAYTFGTLCPVHTNFQWGR